MIDPNHSVSIKIRIEITCDALNRIRIHTSTNHMITLLGMIEIAKDTILKTKNELENESHYQKREISIDP